MNSFVEMYVERLGEGSVARCVGVPGSAAVEDNLLGPF